MTDRAVERPGNNTLVIRINFYINFVAQVDKINLLCAGIVNLHILTRVPRHPVLSQFSYNPHWGLVIYQVAIDYRPAITVLVNRLTEYFSRVQRRRRSETDLHGIEVVQYSSIF